MRISQANLKEAKDNHAIQMMLAHDHDFVQDENPEKTAQEMKDRAAALPPTLRASVVETINNQLQKAKKMTAAEEKPVQSDIFSRGKQDFSHGMFRPATEADITEDVPNKWWFGSTTKVIGKEAKTPTPDTGWQIMATDKERNATELNYAKWQDKMRAFFKQNPEATSEEAQRYSNQLMAPHVEKQVQAAMNPVSDVDKQARAWASEHPDDPRAKKIMERLSR